MVKQPIAGLVVAVMLAGPAMAAAPLYGDNLACTQSLFSDAGDPSYFDGTSIGGQDWACDLKGHCESDGGEWTEKFSVSKTDAKVTIHYQDGRTYTLFRCK